MESSARRLWSCILVRYSGSDLLENGRWGAALSER
uniref:Uncharacterized protein n=1 Tax=Nelumbo nucifera TaxID=4432 RepID=A0A822ZBE7_NELNU|nr:TPA_asm: hypothetical protein HUJ06_015098 [Nelumbo nucifera]